MKKHFLLVIILAIAYSATAQNTKQGSALINIHLAPFSQAGDSATLKFPALFSTYEYFVSDELSIGGIVGYESATVEENILNDGTSRTRFFVGGLINSYLLQGETFDGYLGGSLGYKGTNQEISTKFFYNIYGGLRYYISPTFGIVGEVGLGEMPNIRLGVSFTL